VVDEWEWWLIFFISLAVVTLVYGAVLLSKSYQNSYLVNYFVVPAGILVITTFGCRLAICYYKSHAVGYYPRTFLYCFLLPPYSNTRGMLYVVGYCRIAPDRKTGEISADGASYPWVNSILETEDRVPFESTYLRGVEDTNGWVTCQIRFSIDENSRLRRNYRHGGGLLEFRLHHSRYCSAIKEGSDMYSGHLRAIEPPPSKDLRQQTTDVMAKGYAEWYCDGSPDDDSLEATLKSHAADLKLNLQAMLQEKPQPPLWQERVQVDGRPYVNFWIDEIPEPQFVILDKNLRPHIERLLTRILKKVGMDLAAISDFRDFAVDRARTAPNMLAYELELKQGLVGKIPNSSENTALNERAKIIIREIREYFRGDSLLDIGCGNGLVSYLAKPHFKGQILLVDVAGYLQERLGLSFRAYKEGGPLPTDGGLFDTVLLIAVLHHSNNPRELLKMAWAATKERLIVIESVVGVHEGTPLGVSNDAAAQNDTAEFLGLEDSDQIGYAAFVDWFYNRVLHDDIPTPYNFTAPERWKAEFDKLGMHCTKSEYLGQDMDIGPEYHMLFVFDKNPKGAAVAV
jgi:SAM-dependent methyltransferase